MAVAMAEGSSEVFIILVTDTLFRPLILNNFLLNTGSKPQSCLEAAD